MSENLRVRMMAGHKSDLCEINVVLLREADSGKAWRVKPLSSDRPAAWVAKSLVELHDNGDGKSHQLVIPEWLARKKGLI